MTNYSFYFVNLCLTLITRILRHWYKSYLMRNMVCNPDRIKIYCCYSDLESNIWLHLGLQL